MEHRGNESTPDHRPEPERDRRSQRVVEPRDIWKTERWALCARKICGHVDVYPIGKPTLRGKGSSSKDPVRLQNQRCKACGNVLGRGAHARALKIPLGERKFRRAMAREAARLVGRVAVSLQSTGRGSPGSKAVDAVETTPVKGARRASPSAGNPPERGV